jgi:DNA-binding PucR family transcriptional regulator
VSLYCEDLHPDAMCAVVADRFWALLPTPRDQPRERTLEVARTIVDRVEGSVHVPLRAGIGVSVAGVTDVPGSRRAAEQALEILAKQQPGSPAVHIEDVRPHAVLLELLDLVAQRPALLQGKLDILIAHDEDNDHRTSYIETLRAYFEAGCDAGRAASRLGVHANTMRYRLRRLVELSGLDLDDPDERFVTELQLRAHAHPGPRRRPEPG